MEIGKPQLARLVLGYLKNEKCSTAFNEFLTTSQYLKKHALFVKNGKYFATRVGGLTLEDIMTEYTEISFIIQGRLEQTSYYEEHHKMNLVDQLIYILDRNCQIAAPVLSNDLNTTPSESLPGNSSPRHTQKSSNNQQRPSFGECSPIQHENENMGNISQIISQTLLEKSELHEKLANAINSIRSQDQEAENASASKQLDNKIKTIVQKAEKDPIFDEILGHNPDTSSSTTSKRNVQDTLHHTPKSNDIKKKNTPSPYQPVNRKDSDENPTETATAISVPTSTPNNNSEVIIFNGNLDSYVGKTGTIAPPQQSQIFVANTPGLLMVPSMIGPPNYFIVNSQPNPMTNVVSDADIMKMPTVILDERLPSKQAKETVQPPPIRKCKTLAPKSDNITVSTTSGDYLAVYKDDGQVLVSSSGDDVPNATKPRVRPKPRGSLRKKLPRQAKMKKNENSPEGEKKKSPSTPVNKANVKKTTPRSGSHVRTLNFTTPPKEEDQKKSETSSENRRNTATRSASKGLFTNMEKTGKESRSSAWDSDLRELLIPKNIVTDSPDTSDDNLDLTCADDEDLETNAKLIEAAFKTPVKDPSQNEIKTSSGSLNVAEEQKTEDVPEEKDLSLSKKDNMEIVTVEETEVYLRNINGPPKFKKKCNQTVSSVQKYEVEVVIEKSQPLDKLAEEMARKTTQTQQTRNDLPSTSTSRKAIVLETPNKYPKTPGKCELTPFSKALEEQLQGMDLLSLPTPSLPITPSFPLTPGLGLNTPTVANRPTDYSTSSSYYQPSDTEQNKSLELMIEECKKLEKRTAQDNEDFDVETEENNDEQLVPNAPVNTASSLKEMKRIFNENVIGKKNLNLMKQRSSSSDSSDDSNSSSSSSSSSSTASDSDSEYDPTYGEETVVKKDSYCLRKRAETPKVSKVDNAQLNTKSSAKTPNKIKSIVKEIVDQRERMLTSLKNDVMNHTKSAQKNNQSRDKTIKKSASKRKSRTPSKKESPKTNLQISKICEVENEITDDDFALHLSTDEESINKASETTICKNKEEMPGKIISSIEKETPSDMEAEQLVQGLKERGIHLVHKKSPKKDLSNEEILENKEGNCKGETTQVSPKNDEITSSKNETQLVVSKDEELNNEKNELEISTSSLDLSRNDLDVTFDIQCFEEENLKVDFTNSRRKTKKTVYDLKILEKEMKANVYIESLDMEMERIIKCSSFEAIFDFVPKNSKTRRNSARTSEHPKKESSLTDCSISRNRESQNKRRKEEKVDIEKQEKEEIKQSVSEIKKKSSESKKESEKKQNASEIRKSTPELNNEKSVSKSNPPEKDITPVKSESCEKKSLGCTAQSKNTESANQKSVENQAKSKDSSLGLRDENIVSSTLVSKVTDNVSESIEEEQNDNNERLVNVEWGKSPILRNSDDELMNYAIMGSERVENTESPGGGKKRKYSSSEEGEPTEKKCKTEQQQALLKKIDVDVFLNKVHGSAGKS